MPKTAIDYSQNVIYKIVCNDINVKDCYVGHTTQFRERKASHKSKCNNEKNKLYNLNIYQIIRENGGWSNWSMIEIEKYPCHDGNEARARERHWFETLNANMNGNNPCRTIKEWFDDNKEHIQNYKTQYSLLNAEKEFERHKKYCEMNKDKIKERQKLYHETHKDELKIKQQEYYQKMKEDVKLKRQQNKIEINERERELYQQNKEKRNERKRELYRQKKEKLAELKSQEI